MTYIKELRKRAGDLPLILVRPTMILENRDKEILLVQYMTGTWGLPGGLMEPGETTEETIIRELKEELNIEVQETKLLTVLSGMSYYKKSNRGIESYYLTPLYFTNSYKGTIKEDNDEIKDFGFFCLDRLPHVVTEIDKKVIEEF